MTANIVTVESLTRGCEYVDEKWIRCSRLAYTYHIEHVGGTEQVNVRCREHSEWDASDTIEEGRTLSLGYHR